MEPSPPITPEPSEPVTRPTPPLTDQQQADLADAVTQERYRVEYLQQLRRQSCPGCGESNTLF